jgi:hypothetical protein
MKEHVSVISIDGCVVGNLDAGSILVGEHNVEVLDAYIMAAHIVVEYIVAEHIVAEHIVAEHIVVERIAHYSLLEL